MSTSKKFRTLIINDEDVTDFMKSILEKSDPRVEVLTCPEKLIPGNWYYPSAAEIRGLAGHIEMTGADLTIIGNNMGTGIAIARVLSPNSRNKVVIFFHVPPPNPEHTEQYENMGITNFQTDMMELGKMVTSLLHA